MAFFCNDPLVSYLKGLGYSIVRFPRRDFQPLQILVQQGKDLVDLGQLSTVLVADPSASIPSIKMNMPANDISGQSTGDLSLGVGLTLLGSMLEATGAGNLGLDVKYKSAKTLTFSFSEVLTDAVEIAKLDQFLGAADVNPNSRHIGTLLEADEIYVVTATIKSSKFTVEAKTDRGGEATVSVPEIQQIVGATVEVSASAQSLSKVTYRAPQMLIFGFQAIRLYFEDGRYTAFAPLDPGKFAARDLAPKVPAHVNVLQSESPFARLMQL